MNHTFVHLFTEGTQATSFWKEFLDCALWAVNSRISLSKDEIILGIINQDSTFCLASHADVLRARHAFLPQERLLNSAEKNVDQSQQTSRSGKCTLYLEKFRSWLYSSRKDQKGLMKGEDLTVLEQITQLTHKSSWLPSRSHWKKLPRRLNLLNGSLLYYKTIIKILPFVQSYKVTPPLHHLKNIFMSKWHLLQPLQREIYKKKNAYLMDSRPEKKSLVTYHTLRSLYVCMCLSCQPLWLQQRRFDLQ